MAVRTQGTQAAYAGGWISYPAGTYGAVFKSIDYGATWDSLPTSPADTVTGVLADFEQGPRVFCATTGGVYRTTDEGQTWTRVLAQSGMRAITGSEWRYAAAGDSGVWESTDRGSTWSRLDIGLDVKKVNCLEFIAGTDDWLWLFAGTNGGAVYYWDFGPVGIAAPRSSPARARTSATVCGDRLQLSLDRPGTVLLVDASGRVAFRASLPRGDGTLDLGRLPAGVYQVVPTGGSAASARIVKSR